MYFKYTVTPSTGVPITWKNEPGILVGRGEVRRNANVCYFGYPRGHRTRLSKRCTHEESKASSTTGDGLCHPLSYLVTLFGAHCSPQVVAPYAACYSYSPYPTTTPAEELLRGKCSKL